MHNKAHISLSRVPHRHQINTYSSINFPSIGWNYRLTEKRVNIAKFTTHMTFISTVKIITIGIFMQFTLHIKNFRHN